MWNCRLISNIIIICDSSNQIYCTVMTRLCSISMRLINIPNLEANRGVTYSGSVFLEQRVCVPLCQRSLSSGFAEHVLGGVVRAGAISLRLWVPQVLRGSSVILGIQRCVDASGYSVCVWLGKPTEGWCITSFPRGNEFSWRQYAAKHRHAKWNMH